MMPSPQHVYSSESIVLFNRIESDAALNRNTYTAPSDGIRPEVQHPQMSIATSGSGSRDNMQASATLRRVSIVLMLTPSHVFCTQCADSSGLSQSSNANRQCPACATQLINPDDVVVAGLSPSEDYKTSVLSGLSPSVIMECASRGLAFYSYQASQEIIYQEHLAKSLTEKFNNLNAQMDQLIHDANSQIKMLQDKVQVMQNDQASLEQKNHELIDAFREKSRSQQQIQKLYQTLKAQMMVSRMADAAGDEADETVNTARGDRFVDRIPGARMGAINVGQMGQSQQHGGVGGRKSGSSGSSGQQQQQRGGIGIGPSWNSQFQGRGLSGSRMQTSQSAAVGSPSQSQAGGHRSRLPVLGGGPRQNPFLNTDSVPSFQNSPINRQPFGGGVAPRDLGSYGVGGKTSKRRNDMGNTGPFGR